MLTRSPKPVPLAAIAAIERANAAYRKSRIEAVVLVVGILAAVVSSILRWPLRLPFAASVAFALWALSLIVYSEAYLCLTRSAAETLGRLQDDRKAMKCLFLVLLPTALRLLRVIIMMFAQ
jgi:hypothetical protein